MRMKNRQFETFNDGELTVCETSERNISGIRFSHIRYGNKTVGVGRFFRAKIASEQIDRLVAVPFIQGIRQKDLILLGDKQYSIVQIQDKFDTKPPSRYLSLKESKIAYKDVRG